MAQEKEKNVLSTMRDNKLKDLGYAVDAIKKMARSEKTAIIAGKFKPAEWEKRKNAVFKRISRTNADTEKALNESPSALAGSPEGAPIDDLIPDEKDSNTRVSFDLADIPVGASTDTVSQPKRPVKKATNESPSMLAGSPEGASIDDLVPDEENSNTRVFFDLDDIPVTPSEKQAERPITDNEMDYLASIFEEAGVDNESDLVSALGPEDNVTEEAVLPATEALPTELEEDVTTVGELPLQEQTLPSELEEAVPPEEPELRRYASLVNANREAGVTEFSINTPDGNRETYIQDTNSNWGYSLKPTEAVQFQNPEPPSAEPAFGRALGLNRSAEQISSDVDTSNKLERQNLQGSGIAGFMAPKDQPNPVR